MREDISARTETSKHYLLSDGTMMAEVSQAPVHFRDETDKWAEIDTAFVLDPESGGLVTASTPVVVRVDAETKLTEPVTLVGDGYEVSMNLLGATEQALVNVGGKSFFLSVAPHTSVEYEAMAIGVKETIVLSSPQAGNVFESEITLDGLEVRQVPGRAWGLFRPGGGEPELMLGGLCVFDSSKDAGGEPAYCGDATMTVQAAGDRAVVRVEVPESWLDDPTRVFPVRVDPTITSAAFSDTYVSSQYSGTPYGSAQQLSCGYYGTSGGYNRTLVKFNLDEFSGAYIRTATFSIYQSETQSTSAIETYLGRVTRDWFSDSTWSSLGCVRDNEAGLAASLGQQSPGAGARWVNWDVTGTVQGWTLGSLPNYGLMCYQNEATTNINTRRKFYSVNHSDVAKRPKLQLYYSNPDLRPETGPDDSVYRIGDTVTAKVRVGTVYPEDINCIRATIRGTQNSQSVIRGEFQWTRQWPGTGWLNATAVAGGGYISSRESTAVDLIATQCTQNVPATALGQDYADVDFKWTLLDAYGDVQDNRIEVVAMMDPSDGNDVGNRWVSGLKPVDSSFSVLPNNPPVANASVTPTATAVGSPVAFSSQDSTDDVGIAEYAWDFDSNGTTDSVAANPTHTYQSAATHTWKLTVLDVLGQKGTKTGTVIVRPGKPDILQGVEASAESDEWFIETDADGDGMRDTGSDVEGLGRGAVELQWTPVSGADGYNVYLFDGALFRQVGSAPASAQSWTTRGKEIFPSDTDIAARSAALGAGDDPFVAGGLDLRDDPRGLYAQTPGAEYDDDHRYRFKVVPFDAYLGAHPLSQHETITVALDKRTRRIDDDVRHTTHELGDMFGHDGRVVFDEGALELDVTDLEIASWGPRAALDRHYSSASTATAGFLPGWRFSYDRRVEASATGVTYVDETGQGRWFRSTGQGGFAPPRGYRAELTTSAASGWVLEFPDRTRLTFSSTGALIEERDRNDAAVTYERGEDITVTAANGSAITVDRDHLGRVLEASHVTPDGTRRVTYDAAGITRYPGSADELELEYAYWSDGRLSSFSTKEPVSGLGTRAYWTFAYDAQGRPNDVSALAGSSSPTYLTAFEHGACEATVTVYREVDRELYPHYLSQETVARYEWHPSGSPARRSTFRFVDDDYVQSKPFTYWSWTYTPENLVAGAAPFPLIPGN